MVVSLVLQKHPLAEPQAAVVEASSLEPVAVWLAVRADVPVVEPSQQGKVEAAHTYSAVQSQAQQLALCSQQVHRQQERQFLRQVQSSMLPIR